MRTTDKQIQLFIIPFAGESAGAFKRLVGELDGSIEAIPIEYAGHGSRIHEAAIEGYSDFLRDAAAQVAKQRNTAIPCAVLGYSMGSNIAFDLITQGLIDGEVTHFFPCARAAVDDPGPSLEYYQLPDDVFTEKILELGGIDERLQKNRRFLDIFLRVIRADYRILGQFQYKGQLLPCDISVMYSEGDTSSALVAGWEHLTAGSASFHEMGGPHFFILQHYREMAEVINHTLVGAQ